MVTPNGQSEKPVAATSTSAASRWSEHQCCTTTRVHANLLLVRRPQRFQEDSTLLLYTRDSPNFYTMKQSHNTANKGNSDINQKML